jgi:hypothetical protein
MSRVEFEVVGVYAHLPLVCGRRIRGSREWVIVVVVEFKRRKCKLPAIHMQVTLLGKFQRLELPSIFGQ